MPLNCPACRAAVSESLVNWAEETAMCRQCGTFFGCADWIERELSSPEVVQHPAPGTWFEQASDGFTLGSSLRTLAWIPLSLAALLWSAFLLFFSWPLLRALNDAGRVLWLFVAPFHLVGLLLWLGALMRLCGKLVVQANGDDGVLFRGIGPLGWRRRFDWSQIEKIRISEVYRRNSPTRQQISMEGERVISFARGIRIDRLRFMVAVLRAKQRERIVGGAA